MEEEVTNLLSFTNSMIAPPRIFEPIVKHERLPSDQSLYSIPPLEHFLHGKRSTSDSPSKGEMYESSIQQSEITIASNIRNATKETDLLVTEKELKKLFSQLKFTYVVKQKNEGLVGKIQSRV